MYSIGSPIVRMCSFRSLGSCRSCGKSGRLALPVALQSTRPSGRSESVASTCGRPNSLKPLSARVTGRKHHRATMVEHVRAEPCHTRIPKKVDSSPSLRIASSARRSERRELLVSVGADWQSQPLKSAVDAHRAGIDGKGAGPSLKVDRRLNSRLSAAFLSFAERARAESRAFVGPSICPNPCLISLFPARPLLSSDTS